MTHREKIDDYRKAIPELRDALPNHPDIRMVGVGARETGGECQGDMCFVVGVERKGSSAGSELSREIELPSGRYMLDVRETPDRSKVLTDGALNGSDVLFSDSFGRKGTLGVVIKDASGALYGVTCSHVVGPPGSHATGRSISAAINGPKRTIGAVAHQTNLGSGFAKTDVALVRLNVTGGSLADVLGFERVAEPLVRSAGLSSSVQGGGARQHFYVARSGGAAQIFPCGTPFEMPRGVIMRDSSGANIRFPRVFGMSVGGSGMRAGHSGALLLRRIPAGGLEAVGLMFAGLGGAGYAISWTDIRRSLAGFGVVPV